MKLSLSFNGAQSTLALLQPVVAAAGTNTTITANTMQTWISNNLVTLVQIAN
jgi:hypothetical protein